MHTCPVAKIHVVLRGAWANQYKPACTSLVSSPDCAYLWKDGLVTWALILGAVMVDSQDFCVLCILIIIIIYRNIWLLHMMSYMTLYCICDDRYRSRGGEVLGVRTTVSWATWGHHAFRGWSRCLLACWQVTLLPSLANCLSFSTKTLILTREGSLRAGSTQRSIVVVVSS